MTPQQHATFFSTVQRLQLSPDSLGAAWERCESALSACDGAMAVDKVIEAACRGAMKEVRRQDTPAVLTDATGEGLGTHSYVAGAAASQVKTDVAREAWRLAHSTAKGRMTDYLAWFERNQRGETSDSIAESLGLPSATVRTGVRRARQRIIECANKLRYQKTARKPGELPAELEPVVAAFKRSDLVQMGTLLDAAADAFSEDPHFLLLHAWHSKELGDLDAAVTWLREALIFADVPVIRAKVLNTLGNTYDKAGDRDRARVQWRRAHALDDRAPVPILNLLANASERSDLADCQFYLNKLGELRSKKRLSEGESQFVLERLDDNPEFDWVRRTTPWSRGPARWLKQAANLVAALMLVALPLFGQGCDAQTEPDAELTVEFSALTSSAACQSAAMIELRDAAGEWLGESTLDNTACVDGELIATFILDRAAATVLTQAPGQVLLIGNDAASYTSLPVTFGDIQDNAMLLMAHMDNDAVIGKDEYIRPTDSGRLTKDEYIMPAAEARPYAPHSLDNPDMVQTDNDTVDILTNCDLIGKDEYIIKADDAEDE